MKKPLETALVNGTTSKTDERIAFFGITDKLSSYIMELNCYITDEDTKQELEGIVVKLSKIMGIVAGTGKDITKEELEELLSLTEKHKAAPKVLKNFVLPGKTLLSAKTHIVRTIARECELKYAIVYEKYGGSDNVFEYLNKLSTLFYELAVGYDKNE